MRNVCLISICEAVYVACGQQARTSNHDLARLPNSSSRNTDLIVVDHQIRVCMSAGSAHGCLAKLEGYLRSGVYFAISRRTYVTRC